MRKTLAAVLVLALSAVAVQAVGANSAMFLWGTLADPAPGAEAKVSLADDTRLVFEFKRHKLAVPYDRVTAVEYGYHAGRLVDTDAAIKIATSAGANRSFLTLSYADASDASQIAVFELGSKIAAPVLNNLEQRTRVKIARQGEPRLARVSRLKGASQRAANASFNRAEWLVSLNEWEAGIATVDRFLASEPNLPAALLLRGRAKHNAGRPAQESLADLDLAVKQQPSAQAYMLRAIVRHTAGLSKEALEDCDQAIRYADARGFDPDVIEAQRASGRSLSITWGADSDAVFELQKREAMKLRERIRQEMGKSQ